MIDKWTKKYLKVAKTLAEDNDACLSRKLGGVLVTFDNIPINFAYNGAARGVPHADSYWWLEMIFHNALTENEVKALAIQGIFTLTQFEKACKGVCPRKILGCNSGERLDLCPCSHLERNLIYHAAKTGHSTDKATMYLYCGLPCHDCAIAAIQSGIKKIVCLKQKEDYSKTSRFMFKWAQIEIVEVEESEII
jgi:deoxycytidylate deaminase